MFPLAASGYSFRSLRLLDPHMRGWDCYALQTALDIPADGVFGPITDRALRAFQKEKKLTLDGIGGPMTQRSAVLHCLAPAQKEYDTPGGLGRGMLEGETAFHVGAYTRPYRDGSVDAGVAQENVKPAEGNLMIAFDVPGATKRLCRDLRGRYDAAINESEYVRTPEGAWKFGAVLGHNWPAARARYVAGDIATWKYLATFDPRGPADQGVFVKTLAGGLEQRRYTMAARAQWIIKIGVSGVDTGFEWAHHYVATKVMYVRDWS